ncbi:MAG: hemolysin family protein [Fimbriimonadaceae bacterium]|jgi:putative hemolysin|nr:hemolysin family protein [Fimbriimonadaceae bacterium]
MSDPVFLVVSIVLFAGSAFFVAAEYALVSVRKTKVESEAKRGDSTSKRILGAINDQSRYVAGIQIAITFTGIAVGAVLEPGVSERLRRVLPTAPEGVVVLCSIVLISYPLVVLGELVPKYLALQFNQAMMKVFIRPLQALVWILSPLVWLFQKSGFAILRLLRIDPEGAEAGVSREELAVLVRESHSGGDMEEEHSDMVNKALRLDQLDARDVMAHRLDIKWIDVNLSIEEVKKRLGEISHSRIPICNGDIDEVLGVLYLQDIVKHIENPLLDLKGLIRPVEFVPESLSLDRVVQRMRESKTQILIVRDEYGGTQGLLTLEDVVEEVFGDLEDTLESERPPIERASSVRLSARADVRYDEVLEFLDVEPSPTTPYTTETLAEILIDELKRTPIIGDAVELEFGKIRVEQITQRRPVRFGVYLRRK